MELNDIYDENRNLTGRVHRRGTHWNEGEYGLVALMCSQSVALSLGCVRARWINSKWEQTHDNERRKVP